jgi:glycerol-3-phosphate dehydrogenase (NAD(P)+)
MGPRFRVYTNDDVVGCEVAGSVKNVIAIAAGIADGLGLGLNTKAALLTRGLAELCRLGTALGGRPLTFLGLAGNGDLIATCGSEKSRNHRVGVQLGLGRSIDEIRGEMHMVAEGIATTPAVLGLAARAGVEMPIAQEVAEVIAGRRVPEDAVDVLMGRAPRSETDDQPTGA